MRPSSGARSKHSALSPIGGAQWGPRRRDNQNQIRNVQETESEDIENRRNGENSTKKHIKNTLKKILPDLLGELLVHFFDLLSSRLDNAEDTQEDKKQLIKTSMKRALTAVLDQPERSDSSSEENSEEEEGDMEVTQEDQELGLATGPDEPRGQVEANWIYGNQYKGRRTGRDRRKNNEA